MGTKLPEVPLLVPPIRIDFSEADREWIAERIKEVLITGRLTLGPYGETFEKRFADFTGAKHAVAVSNGTAAIEIVLRSIGVAGRDILVPANTSFATAAAVIAAGARPILMDTDLRTLSTAAAEVERRLTANTAGAIIVHIGGLVRDELLGLRIWGTAPTGCEARRVVDVAHCGWRVP